MTAQISFEESIDRGRELIERLQSMSPDDSETLEEIRNSIKSLLCEVVSARGFFVSLLTGQWSFGQKVPDLVIEAIRATPEPSYELLVKNLAMSNAARVANLRNGKVDDAHGSLTVSKRTAYIIIKISDANLKGEMQWMLAALDFTLASDVEARVAPLITPELQKKMPVINELISAGQPKEPPVMPFDGYTKFLNLWKYDSQQLHEIRKAVYITFGSMK